MSEADNATPVEENVAPVAEAVVEPVAEQKVEVPKFGEFLKYAPDDLKEAKTWDKFKDVDMSTALKAIVDMDKWTGKRGDIPQDGASEDEWKAFYNKLGVPEDASAYEFGAPENVEMDDATTDTLRQLAQKHNLTKGQEGVMSDMLSIYSEMKAAETEASNAAVEKAQADLDAEWGTSSEEMGKAVQALENHYGMTPEQMDVIESNPMTLILLGKIAKDLDEKGQVGNVFSQTQIGLKDEMADVESQIRTVLAANGRNVNDPKLTNLLERRDRLQTKMS